MNCGPFNAPHTPVTALRLFHKARITNAEIRCGTLAVLASPRTMGDTFVIGPTSGVLNVSALAGAHIWAGTIGVQARPRAVRLANVTLLI